MKTKKPTKKLKLEDLYFGVRNWDDRQRKLVTHNIFEYREVREDLALYVNKSDKEKRLIKNPLLYVFGSVWSRCQYEYIVRDWPCGDKEEKVDLYSMYILPNKDYLLDLISRVSKNSTKPTLREIRKRQREYSKLFKKLHKLET